MGNNKALGRANKIINYLQNQMASFYATESKFLDNFPKEMVHKIIEKQKHSTG
jgi:hypothetical protein